MSIIDDLLSAFADQDDPLFDAVDAHRARQADLAGVPDPAPGEFSPAYECALDEARYAEGVARKLLSEAAGEAPAPLKLAAPVEEKPVDWSRSGWAA